MDREILRMEEKWQSEREREREKGRKREIERVNETLISDEIDFKPFRDR